MKKLINKSWSSFEGGINVSEESRKKINWDEPVVSKEHHSFNAWIIRLGEEARTNKYSVTLDISSSECQGLHEGDALALVEERSGEVILVAFARIYLKRAILQKTILLFDGILEVESSIIGLENVQSLASITRLDWLTFEKSLKTVCNIEFSSFPTLIGNSPQEQSYIRDLLQMAVYDDLLGPAGGPEEEIVEMSVRDRYLVGRLAPQETRFEEASTTCPMQVGELIPKIQMRKLTLQQISLWFLHQ